MGHGGFSKLTSLLAAVDTSSLWTDCSHPKQRCDRGLPETGIGRKAACLLVHVVICGEFFSPAFESRG